MAMKIIKLKHSKNIRDIGGVYRNVTLKEGMLIRGRTLTGLDEADIKILTQDNHVRTIIDLRSQKEQQEEGEMHIPGVKHLTLPVFESEELEAPFRLFESSAKDGAGLCRFLAWGVLRERR